MTNYSHFGWTLKQPKNYLLSRNLEKTVNHVNHMENVGTIHQLLQGKYVNANPPRNNNDYFVIGLQKIT